MTEIFFSAALYLQQGLLQLLELRVGQLLFFGAVPFVLFALTLLFEVRARFAFLLALLFAALPFVLRWAVFGDIENDALPILKNGALVSGAAASLGFLVLALLLLLSALPQFRIRGLCKSAAFYVFALAALLIVATSSVNIGAYEVTSGPFASAGSQSAQWIGQLIGLGLFFFLANLLPAAIGGAIPLAGRGKPVHMLVSLAAAGAAGWFLFWNFNRFQDGLRMLGASPAL